MTAVGVWRVAAINVLTEQVKLWGVYIDEESAKQAAKYCLRDQPTNETWVAEIAKGIGLSAELWWRVYRFQKRYSYEPVFERRELEQFESLRRRDPFIVWDRERDAWNIILDIGCRRETIPLHSHSTLDANKGMIERRIVTLLEAHDRFIDICTCKPDSETSV